jgi:hypothetical protein
VVYPTEDTIPERWLEDFKISNGMLEEAKVLVRSIE